MKRTFASGTVKSTSWNNWMLAFVSLIKQINYVRWNKVMCARENPRPMNSSIEWQAKHTNNGFMRKQFWFFSFRFEQTANETCCIRNVFFVGVTNKHAILIKCHQKKFFFHFFVYSQHNGYTTKIQCNFEWKWMTSCKNTHENKLRIMKNNEMQKKNSVI